jgi:hypothetical protein
MQIGPICRGECGPEGGYPVPLPGLGLGAGRHPHRHGRGVQQVADRSSHQIRPPRRDQQTRFPWDHDISYGVHPLIGPRLAQRL